MMAGRAMFENELRSAVSEVRNATPVRVTQPPPPPKKRTRIWLWLPLTPIWILAAPLALIGAPALAFFPETRGLPPYKTAFAIGATLLSLSGTVIEVTSPDAVVSIRIF